MVLKFGNDRKNFFKKFKIDYTLGPNKELFLR